MSTQAPGRAAHGRRPPAAVDAPGWGDMAVTHNGDRFIERCTYDRLTGRGQVTRKATRGGRVRTISPDMPSFRTSAAVTTNSPLMLHRSYVSRRPSLKSLNSLSHRPQETHGDCDQATQQSRRGSWSGLRGLAGLDGRPKGSHLITPLSSLTGRESEDNGCSVQRLRF